MCLSPSFLLIATTVVSQGAITNDPEVLVTVSSVELMSGRDRIGTLAAGGYFEVAKSNGSWVTLRDFDGNEIRGWTQRSKLYSPKQADRYYGQKIRTTPQDASLYLARGGLRHQLVSVLMSPYPSPAAHNKWLRLAMDDLNEALRIESKNVTALIARADLHDALGNLDRAKQDLTHVLEIDKTNTDALRQRARIHSRQFSRNRVSPDAIQDYKRLLEALPEDEEAKRFLKRAGVDLPTVEVTKDTNEDSTKTIEELVKSGSVDLALAEVRKKFSTLTSEHHVHHETGKLLARLGRYQEALVQFDKATVNKGQPLRDNNPLVSFPPIETQ